MLPNHPSPEATFQLREEGPDDRDFLEKLFREVKAVEFALLDLAPDVLVQLLDMQYKAQQMAFASQYPNATHKIVLIDGTPVGRIVTDQHDDAVSLVDIALLERCRRQGTGSKVLQHVCADAASRQCSVRLTVRFDNPAQRLYHRAGFVQTGGDGLHLIMEWRPDSLGEQTSDAEEQTETETDDPLTSRRFRTLLGKTLPAQSVEGPCVDLVLQSVEPLRAANRPANARVPVGDSFALIFSGPPQPVLPTAMTRLTTPSGENLEVFLSAFGWTDGRMHYEAIFNRMAG